MPFSGNEAMGSVEFLLRVPKEKVQLLQTFDLIEPSEDSTVKMARRVKPE